MCYGVDGRRPGGRGRGAADQRLMIVLNQVLSKVTKCRCRVPVDGSIPRARDDLRKSEHGRSGLKSVIEVPTLAKSVEALGHIPEHRRACYNSKWPRSRELIEKREVPVCLRMAYGIDSK